MSFQPPDLVRIAARSPKEYQVRLFDHNGKPTRSKDDLVALDDDDALEKAFDWAAARPLPPAGDYTVLVSKDGSLKRRRMITVAAETV